MITPEIREIKVFLAIVKNRSFSTAAKDLGITQPAVSAHVSHLEQIVGFPLLQRHPEGTTVTEQGRIILPYLEKIEHEYDSLLHRADYWKRAQSHEVNIWTDGSMASQELKRRRLDDPRKKHTEHWHNLESEQNWIDALTNFETDIVIAGSFLRTAEIPGIRSNAVHTEAGVTVWWNPEYYLFNRASFAFPDVLSSNLILPSQSLATGFRKFLSEWCEEIYGVPQLDFIEFHHEQEAFEACKVGLGVMVYPGGAMRGNPELTNGLQTHTVFGSLLPKAYTLGIRWRANEQNPRIIETVKELLGFSESEIEINR